MAEWLYEAGIGEARAALIEDGAIVEANIEPYGDGLRVGAELIVRLVEKQGEGRRGLVRSLDGQYEAMIEPLPRELAIGQSLGVAVVREALTEPGAIKRAKVRAAPDAAEVPGPSLLDRIMATGIGVTVLTPHIPDVLEAAGWSETLEAAHCGEQRFPGGALRISLTPAMTLIDIDGDLPPLALAIAGARAAAATIRRWNITGSIGVDLPTVAGKVERAAIGEAFDAVLPPPFERTAVNGFGFLQVVRSRQRASLCEILQYDAATAQARALLRRAQRSGLTGATLLVTPPAVAGIIERNAAWLATLARQLGGPVSLRVSPALAMSASYVTKSL